MSKRKPKPQPVPDEIPDLSIPDAPDMPDMPDMPGLDDDAPREPQEAPDAPPEPQAPTDVEQAAKEVLEALQNDFQERAKAEERRFQDATDSEYWFCVGFQNREQKETFLRAIGLDPDGKYLDGQEVAKALRVTLPEPGPLRYPRPISKKLTDLT